MEKYKTHPLTQEELNMWYKNKAYNPRTNRKIKETGKIWKLYHNTYYTNKLPKDRYMENRKKAIDPILGIDLPLKKKKKYYKFEYMWNPYSGTRETKDPRGYLSFDPDSLIYYFYSRRLKYLWNISNNDYTGHYGDAVGNGPDFYIPGRGKHNDWYLFRLPILDGYISSKEWNQNVTMGPILTLNEIKEIYNMGKTYGNMFKQRFNIDRPNLIKIYQLYHIAIDKHPKLNIPDDLNINLDEETRTELEMLENRKAVNELKNL